MPPVSFEQKYRRLLDSPVVKRKRSPRCSVLPAIEDCSICFNRLKPPIGTLISVCPHRFCFDCIVTWAKRNNTCPLCKRLFKLVVKEDGDHTDLVTIKTPKKDKEEVAREDFFNNLHVSNMEFMYT